MQAADYAVGGPEAVTPIRGVDVAHSARLEWAACTGFRVEGKARPRTGREWGQVDFADVADESASVSQATKWNRPILAWGSRVAESWELDCHRRGWR